MAVTIQELCTIATNYISNICTNITNYNNIALEFKAGYSRRFNHNRSFSTFAIINPISQVNEATITSQLSSYLSNNAFTDLNAEVSSSTLISIYTLIAAFTSARVNLVTSQFSSDSYICYNADTVSYDLDSADILNDNSEIIFSSEGLSASYHIQRIIQQSIKTKSIQYSVSISGYSFNDNYLPTGNVDVDNTTPAIVYVPSQYLISLVSSSVSQTVLQNHPSGGRSSSSGYLKFTINTTSKDYTEAYLVIECGFRLPGYRNSYTVCWSWEPNSTNDIYSNALPSSFSASPNTISGRQEVARFAISKSGSLIFNLAYCFNYWTNGAGDTASPQTIYIYYKVINAYGGSEYIEKTFRV